MDTSALLGAIKTTLCGCLASVPKGWLCPKCLIETYTKASGTPPAGAYSKADWKRFKPKRKVPFGPEVLEEASRIHDKGLDHLL